MKQTRYRTLLWVALAATSAACRSSPPETRPAPNNAERFYLDGLRRLAGALVAIDSALVRGSTAKAIEAYRDGRRAYKRIESLLLYYNPIETAEVNGPRTDDDDDALVSAGVPVGFQVLEATLFEGSIPRDTSVTEVRRMQSIIGQLRAIAATNPMTDADAVDAARMELVRVALLGLAGIDTDASGDAVLEAAEALDGVRDMLHNVATPPPLRLAVDSTLKLAISELRADPDYDRFNRLRFIVGFVRPAAAAIAASQAHLGLAAGGVRRAWRSNAVTVFEANALDPMAYAPPYARTPTPELIALGRQLFFDPRLAGSENRSCATCHQPDRAFTDGLPRAEPLPGHPANGLRNTPTLLNVALQPRLFSDDRTRELEAQIGQVLESKAEMASSADMIAARLRTVASYRAAFAAAMPDHKDGIGGVEVRQAIASYLRSLVALDSPFDRAARGDTLAISAQARFGFTVFMGKARCGTCHFAPLFNGVTPPEFDNAEAEIIGVLRADDFRRPELDPDQGRLVVEGVETNRFAFKVPTLRNVALTAPYMHNGVFGTLDRVVHFYDRGGGAGLGVHVPNQTLASRRLRLTPAERSALVVFMEALTDTVLVSPVR